MGGLWLLGDWKVCQAQYIIFMRVASGHMFCVESIFIVYKCTPLCIMLVYLLSTMHNGMKHGLVCVEREGLEEVVRCEWEGQKGVVQKWERCD